MDKPFAIAAFEQGLISAKIVIFSFFAKIKTAHRPVFERALQAGRRGLVRLRRIQISRRPSSQEFLHRHLASEVWRKHKSKNCTVTISPQKIQGYALAHWRKFSSPS
jgi:hypothetical protein